MKKKLLLRKNLNKLVRSLFIMMFITGIAVNGYSQTIVSYKSRLQALDPSLAAHLKNLVTGLNPSVNLSKGEITTYGTGSPVVAISDAASVNQLFSNNPAFSQVELIRLTITNAGEIPSAIDLTQMQGFNNLQYLLIVFGYDACGGSSDNCLSSKLGGIIQGASSPVIVLYDLSIPE